MESRGWWGNGELRLPISALCVPGTQPCLPELSAVLPRSSRGMAYRSSRREAPFAQIKPFMPNHIETFDVRKHQYCLCLQGQLGVYLVGTGVKSSFRGTCGKFSELAVELVFYQLGKMLTMPYSPLPYPPL